MQRAELHINLNSISNNLNQMRKLTLGTVETGAVVKANAYGLGIARISSHLYDEGVKTFFVSSVDEAVELRNLISKNTQIYYLNGYSLGDFEAIRDWNIIPVLNSLDQIENFKSEASKSSAAVQLDVGMSRLGLKSSEVTRAKETLSSTNLKLVVGHLSSADDKNDPENIRQLNSFTKLSSLFPNTRKSLAATGGTVLGKKFHFDLTRPGIGLFGGKPLRNAETVISIKAPVLQIKTIRKNSGVGYNLTYTTSRRTKIATLAVGYADGLLRQLSNRGVFYAGKIACPIIGRISMDLVTVDISNVNEEPKALTMFGPHQTIDDLAVSASTIGYEMLTNLGSRYKRVYHH